MLGFDRLAIVNSSEAMGSSQGGDRSCRLQARSTGPVEVKPPSAPRRGAGNRNRREPLRIEALWRQGTSSARAR